MTFEQWQQTKVWSDDLRSVTQEDHLQQGYVYGCSCWIVVTERDGKSYYSTIIGNTEPESETLSDVERELFRFCESEDL